MRRVLIIISILAFILGVFLIVLVLNKRTMGSPTSPSAVQSTTTLPASGLMPTTFSTGTQIATATASIITISTQSDIVSVNDFIHNGVTVADPENPGNYYLAGSIGYCLSDGTCLSGAPESNFDIIYNVMGNSFTIGLLAEPIGQARLDAQQFLMQTLNISQAQMCTLHYYIGVAEGVNEQFSGENLGFSFCSGATILPQ